MTTMADSPHRRAWDLVPWVVAGSASEAERALVEAHAAGCADCRAELEFHRRLHHGMALAAPAAHAPDAALQRLWARIDDDAAVTTTAPAPTTRPPRELTRWLAAAVVLQAVGLAALGAMLWERPRAADYRTLSQPPASSAAAIRLVPAPGLRVGELQALLARTGWQIADSRGDGSVLGLAPRLGVPADVPETLRRLRAEPGVLLAEPITD